MPFGVTELIIILVIVLLLFGTPKLKSLGTDLGSAIKGFRTAVSDEDEKNKTDTEEGAEANAQAKEKSEAS